MTNYYIFIMLSLSLFISGSIWYQYALLFDKISELDKSIRKLKLENNESKQ